jgi:hypothetical protein
VVRIAGYAGWVGGLLNEGSDRAVLVCRHHPETGCFFARHYQTADCHVRTRIDVLLQHQFVVHLVDVIARKDHHVFGRVGLDDVDVLIDRIGSAFIPLQLGNTLRGGEDIEAFVAFGPQEVPRPVHVADQRVRLVLRGDADAADAGIERVGQGEIDDPALAAEIDGGLGAHIGHFHQPAAAPPRQNIGHRVAGQRLFITSFHEVFSQKPELRCQIRKSLSQAAARGNQRLPQNPYSRP